ncbi:hypothetical protein J2T57_001247 [Natronocella acetinitrilica]|uniref:DUF3592 domain-containing protein n=1 Tax=Natronocella acetinitrilica TaxID=414046 RepID=A0AAE3G1W7_9GAMM|nr:DUF3592 domain-containing protein [Natronocella acetinitrilica]MCP1674145.1 hypothetical protein [Natronocella acetinitrilica]
MVAELVFAAVLVFLLAGGLAAGIRESGARVEALIVELLARAEAMPGWRQVRGVVLELGINCERPAAATLLPDIAYHGEIDEEAALAAAQAAHREALDEMAHHHGVLIRYRYEVDGVAYVGRAVSPFMTDACAELVYRLAPGQRLRVLVDPERPEIAFLRRPRAADVERHRRALHARLLRQWCVVGALLAGGILALGMGLSGN